MLEHRDLGDAVRGAAAICCYGISYGHIHFPEQGPAIECGRFWGVGSQGVGWRRVTPESGPRALGVGRWVFGREYLDDGESYLDSKTRPDIFGA